MADNLASAKSFLFINFRHLYKDLNIAAHELDRFCFIFHMEPEYFDSFFYWLLW